MRQLGSLEAVVMKHLWESTEPLAVREVREQLGRERPLAYTTVMTVLDNLYRKGLVSRRKRGRAYVYSASQTREEHTAELMGEVLTDAGDRGVALLRFVEQLSPEEVAELHQLLADVQGTLELPASDRAGEQR